MRVRISVVMVVLVCYVGCSATQDEPSLDPTSVDPAGPSVSSVGGAGGAGGAVTSVTSGAGGGFDPSGSGGAPEIAEVFGHSANQLYRLDPLTKAVNVVGDLVGCGTTIDLAIDADNEIVAASSNGLFRVDRDTAACTLISSGSYPNSLSFVPVGTLDPNEEALVGYSGSTYVRIDPSGGDVTAVGSLGDGLSSSGDVVSVEGGGTYLTVVGAGCADCLVEIDPATGALIENLGPVGYGGVFGLAFWGGRAYGFTSAGDLFEIEFGNGSVSSTPIPLLGVPPGLSFFGAGSSTTVPVNIPR